MPPIVQVAALYQLNQTGNEELQAESLATLRKLAPGVLEQVAGERMLPLVLDRMATVFVDSGDVPVH